MQIVGLASLHHPVVHSKATGEDSRIAAPDLFDRDSSILKTLVRNFKQLSLLRVHECSFNIVDAEKTVFELAQIFMYEVATTHAHAADFLSTIGVVKGINVPSFRRYITLPGSFFYQEIPEIRGGFDLPRKPTACRQISDGSRSGSGIYPTDADNGDRLVFCIAICTPVANGLICKTINNGMISPVDKYWSGLVIRVSKVEHSVRCHS